MPENIAGAALQDHRAIAVHLAESRRRAAVNRHQIRRGRSYKLQAYRCAG